MEKFESGHDSNFSSTITPFLLSVQFRKMLRLIKIRSFVSQGPFRSPQLPRLYGIYIYHLLCIIDENYESGNLCLNVVQIRKRGQISLKRASGS